MLSRVLPSSSLPQGFVVETKLVLPARWRSAFTSGDPGVLSASERVVIATTQDLFGFCTDVDIHTADTVSPHDAMGEGIEPCPCLVYTFIDHESIPSHQP